MKNIHIPHHLPKFIKQRILIIACFILSTSIRQTLSTEIEIIECLKKITNSHFHDKMVLLLYWREHDLEVKKLNYNQKTGNWMNSIIRFMVTSTDWTVYVSNQFYVEPNHDYFYFKLERQKARNIIMLLQSDSFNMTNKIRKLMENKSWNSRSKVLIVIQDDVTRYDEILKNVWNFKKALDVVVMGIGGDFINFFTSYPYHRHEKGTLINIWKNLRFLHNRNLYENKIPKDFQGHVLFAGTTFSEPYVLKPKTPNEYKDGVEIRIVKALAGYSNFSLRYVASPKGQSPYVAMKNGKPSGLFGFLYNQTIDMVFFGFRNRFDRHKLSDILSMHTEDNTVWVVPLPDPTRSWDYLYKVFSPVIWVTIFISTFVISATLYALRYYDLYYSKCLLETLSITINMPTPYKIIGPRLRLFIFMLYMYSLHMTSAYQSFLITLWTKPMEGKPYETPQEAVEGGLISYLYPSGRPAYNRSDHEMWNKILTKGNHIYSDDYPTTLAIIARNKTAFTLMIENVAKYEVSTRLLSENKKPLIHIIKKKFGPYPISIFMSLGHPLVDLFNKKIQQLVEAGIVKFWLHDLLNVYRRVEHKKHAEYQAKKPLKLRHFEGTFLIIVAGWLMSATAFLLEYYVKRNEDITFTKFFQRTKHKSLIEKLYQWRDKFI